MKLGNVFSNVRSEYPCMEFSKDFPTADRLGIEIELENVEMFHRWVSGGFNDYWEIVEDNSLRDGGREIRLKEGLFGKGLEAAFEELEKSISNYTKMYEIGISDRTSVHVHLSADGMDVDGVLQFLSLYLTFEKVLFRISGGRENNIYCLPLGTTQGLEYISEVALFKENAIEIQERLSTPKYSAVNFQPLGVLGTIEFRHHEGTYDVQRIKRWCKYILNLKIFAMSEKNINVPEEVSRQGYLEFAANIFKEDTQDIAYPDLAKDILEGARTAQMFNNLFLIRERAAVYQSHVRHKKDSVLLINEFAKANNINVTKSKKTDKNTLSLSPEQLAFHIDEEAQDVIDDDEPEEVIF